MRIRPEWAHGTLILKNEQGGLAFCSDHWPRRLAIKDMLRALCGEPDDEGWFVCHESHQWLERNLRSVSQLGSYEIGLLAIRDAAELGGDAASTNAAGTLAVSIFEHSFGGVRTDAQLLARMNFIGTARLQKSDS